MSSDVSADIQSHGGGPLTEKRPAAVILRPFRAALCLGVLCVLMMTGIILLSIQHISVTLEKNHLQNKYDQLSNNCSQLQGTVSGKSCPDGWTRFDGSCYFKSNERKGWYGSRDDCLQAGADLLVLNNKEEKKFVTELNMQEEESWIGLLKKWGTSDWEWVDRSPLTEFFWESELPHNAENQYAACCDQQGQWTHSRASEKKKWICEKKIP